MSMSWVIVIAGLMLAFVIADRIEQNKNRL
jgi:hypothetical protein